MVLVTLKDPILLTGKGGFVFGARALRGQWIADLDKPSATLKTMKVFEAWRIRPDGFHEDVEEPKKSGPIEVNLSMDTIAAVQVLG